MKIVRSLFTSSLGRKYLMAGTGLLLVFFVLGHLVGNLQIFLGRETINAYGHFLQSNPEILWPTRIALLTLVALHLWSSIRLWLENRAARPVNYAGNPAPVGASLASRTMLLSGGIIAAFVIYHLLHYTVRVESVNLTGADFGGLKEVLPDGTQRHDVYSMMILGFRQMWVSLFYALGVGLLGLHLGHALPAMFQSLGWRNHRWRACIDRVGPWLAWAMVAGYLSIPLAVLLGYGKEVVK